MYTTQYCSYCYRAKDLLDRKDVKFEEIAVDNSMPLRQEMMEKSGRYTVPQIFINNRSIGGCDELHQLERSGQLDSLLNENIESNSIN